MRLKNNISNSFDHRISELPHITSSGFPVYTINADIINFGSISALSSTISPLEALTERINRLEEEQAENRRLLLQLTGINNE